MTHYAVEKLPAWQCAAAIDGASPDRQCDEPRPPKRSAPTREETQQNPALRSPGSDGSGQCGRSRRHHRGQRWRLRSHEGSAWPTDRCRRIAASRRYGGPRREYSCPGSADPFHVQRRRRSRTEDRSGLRSRGHRRLLFGQVDGLDPRRLSRPRPHGDPVEPYGCGRPTGPHATASVFRSRTHRTGAREFAERRSDGRHHY